MTEDKGKLRPRQCQVHTYAWHGVCALASGHLWFSPSGPFSQFHYTAVNCLTAEGMYGQIQDF